MLCKACNKEIEPSKYFLNDGNCDNCELETHKTSKKCSNCGNAVYEQKQYYGEFPRKIVYQMYCNNCHKFSQRWPVR